MLSALLSIIKEIIFVVGYVNGSNSFPGPLPAAEEKRLIALSRTGDEEAKSKLVEHNLRLVAHIAKKYAVNGRSSDDLISIGTIGLIKAVASFNSDKGSTLSTFAAKCIENEILMSIRAEKRSVSEISLNEAAGKDKEGNELSIEELLGTDSDEIAEIVELRLMSDKLRTTMTRFLTKREQTVLELRYGLWDNSVLTQREIASRLKISRSYVSRIETKALSKLRKAYAGQTDSI